MLSTSTRRSLFYGAFFVLASTVTLTLGFVGGITGTEYSMARFAVGCCIMAIAVIIHYLWAKGFKGSKLNEREHRYPFAHRAYLWGLRTHWYGYAYDLATYWVMVMGCALIVMSLVTTLSFILGTAMLSLSGGMALTGMWMKSRYWAFIDRQLTEAHLRTATELRDYIVAQATAHPGQPVDLSAYFHPYPCNPRNMVFTADTPQDPKGTPAEHGSHT